MYQVLTNQGDPFIYMTPDGNRWYWYDPNSKPLGAGAMGTVYLGYDLNTREQIAIKRVRDEYANNPEIRQRAINEAHLIFYHPHIVKMLGVCTESPDRGPIFILSEFIPGQTIEDFAKNTLVYLSPQEKVTRILELTIPLLDAIQVLHDSGVIHRDIKPSNIMVETDGNCKLMDLGIAKTLSTGFSHRTVGFIGTTQYAAPELLVGNGQVSTGDYRVDIYAFGVTIFELISGENPFDAPSQAEVMIKQAKAELPPSPAVPSRLLAILRKATAKRREERYQSAMQMKNALYDYLTSGSKMKINNRPMITAFIVMGVLSIPWMIALINIYNNM